MNPYLAALVPEEEMAWRRKAVCTSDPEKWFAEGMAGELTRQAAKNICNTQCPVKAECLAAAIASPSTSFGIWGGEDFRNRGSVLRRLKVAVGTQARLDEIRARDAELMRLYTAGLNDREISESLGVHLSTVNHWRTNNRLARVPRKGRR